MIQKVWCHFIGLFSLLILGLNTVFWSVPLLAAALAKYLIPIRSFRKGCEKVLNGCAGNWIAVNNRTQDLLGLTRWRVDGTDDLDPGGWYLVVANHQSWVDILVLQKIFHRKIPFLKFFLKKELIWFPILGQAWWALDFPFMKRYSKGFLKKHPHLKGRDLEITRKACDKFKTLPVSIMNFAEGTRFSKEKHERQHSPHRHLLRPKAGGLAFTLAAMGEHLKSFLDVTIAYPNGPVTFWAYLCGNVGEIRVEVRCMPITRDILGDYVGDGPYRNVFQRWLNAVWTQKDGCMDRLLGPLPDRCTGEAAVFPCPTGSQAQPDSGAGRQQAAFRRGTTGGVSSA